MEFSAGQIAALLGGKLIGKAQAMVSDVAPIESAQPHHLSFITDAKYMPYLENTQAGAVLVSEGLVANSDSIRARFEESKQAVILVENARGAMGMLLQLVSKALNPAKQGIEQPVSISESVVVPEDAYIGAFAYIGKNVQLGKGVQIYPNTYIGDNVVIGDNTILYAGVKVYAHSVIGANCILHAGVPIGTHRGRDLVPAHALALSTTLHNGAFPQYDADYATAIAYLRKEAITLPTDTPRGFVLITYKGHPLGFVKNVGNRANNLYPQEWRIRSSHVPEDGREILI